MKHIILLLLIFLLQGCELGSKAPSPKKNVEYTKSTNERVASPDARERADGETELSFAVTELADSSPSRVKNIDLACGAVNGTVLYPGGSFSFNSAVGRRSEDNGYADAPVIVDGHKEQGCGGGVCQVSSTLYMAAKSGGLQIDERHPHSHSVPYAPNGNDATVVYGQKDLKFTNNTDFVVTLYVWTDGESVFSNFTKKEVDKNIQ